VRGRGIGRGDGRRCTHHEGAVVTAVVGARLWLASTGGGDHAVKALGRSAGSSRAV
jgi:hypothetical protein